MDCKMTPITRTSTFTRKPCNKFHLSNIRHPIVYPFQISKQIEFCQVEGLKYLGIVDIRNLALLPMIYKFVYSNPVVHPLEFEYSTSHGTLAFEEASTILVSPTPRITPEYLECAIFELWIAPESAYLQGGDHPFGENWPDFVRDDYIMKTSITCTLRSSQTYMETLLMKGISDQSVSRTPSSMSIFDSRDIQSRSSLGQYSTSSRSHSTGSVNHLNSSTTVKDFVKQVIAEQEEMKSLSLTHLTAEEESFTKILQSPSVLQRRKIGLKEGGGKCGNRYGHSIYFLLNVGGVFFIFLLMVMFQDTLGHYLDRGLFGYLWGGVVG